jgi:hypothetical protein
MTGKPIVFCEPQCWDFEHYLFNAALLHTTLLAFPNQPVIFAGERGHSEYVRTAVMKHAPEHLSRITWMDMPVPERSSKGWGRVRSELVWIRRILQIASDTPTHFVLLSSISEPGLLALKWRLSRTLSRVPVLAVTHSMLGSLLVPGSRRPWLWLLHVRQILRFPHPRQLHYIVLGGSLYRTLEKRLPQLISYFSSIDHPWFWATMPGPPDAQPPVVRFGYFGAAYKGGMDLFHRLARAIHDVAKRAEFLLVGFVPQGAESRYSEDIRGVSSTPLSSEEYDRRARSITHAIWVANPENYRLAASASFLDALSYIKPGLYLRNEYVAYYFDRMGDIGYLCDGYEELEATARSIAVDFPAERYAQQRVNIEQGRRMFEPSAVAEQLQSIIAACENTLAS